MPPVCAARSATTARTGTPPRTAARTSRRRTAAADPTPRRGSGRTPGSPTTTDTGAGRPGRRPRRSRRTLEAALQSPKRHLQHEPGGRRRRPPGEPGDPPTRRLLTPGDPRPTVVDPVDQEHAAAGDDVPEVLH